MCFTCIANKMDRMLFIYHYILGENFEKECIAVARV